MKKNDVAILEALVEASSLTDAAKAAGVARSTLQRRLRDPAFREKLAEARSTAFSAAMTRLAAHALEAVDVLIQGMRGRDISKTRFLCAREILTQAQAVRSDDMEDRLAEIERQIGTVIEAATTAA